MASSTEAKVQQPPTVTTVTGTSLAKEADESIKAVKRESIKVVLRLKNDGFTKQDATELENELDSESLSGSRPSSISSSDVFARLTESAQAHRFKVTYDAVAEDPHIIQCGEKKHKFDRIMGPDTTQEDVFAQTVVPLVKHTLNGYNTSLLAYGQSGSGKTHTIFGDAFNEGIVPRIIQHLGRQTEVKISQVDVSMVEVYNEKIYDLDFEEPDPTFKVTASLTNNKSLKSYASDSTRLDGLCFRQVSTWADLALRIERNCKRRTVDATMLNARSTRAHTIVVIRLTINKGAKKTLTPEIYLVDLCGSEDVRKSQVTGSKLVDTIHINLSLTMLTTVVRQLSSGQFASFRDSVLTELLRNSLGGNAMTCFIVCCSMLPSNQRETYNSIQFGVRLKKIKNTALVNGKLSYEEAIRRMNAYFAKMMMLAEENQKLKALLAQNKIKLPTQLQGTNQISDPDEEDQQLPIDSASSSIRSESAEVKKENMERRRSVSLQTVVAQIESAQKQEALIQTEMEKSAVGIDMGTDPLVVVEEPSVAETEPEPEPVHEPEPEPEPVPAVQPPARPVVPPLRMGEIEVGRNKRLLQQAKTILSSIPSVVLEKQVNDSIRKKKKNKRKAIIPAQAFEPESKSEAGEDGGEHEAQDMPKEADSGRDGGGDHDPVPRRVISNEKPVQRIEFSRQGLPVRRVELANRLVKSLLGRIVFLNNSFSSLP